MTAGCERRLVFLGSLIMAAGFGLFPYASGTTAGLVLCLVALTTGFCLVGPSLAGLVSQALAAAVHPSTWQPIPPEDLPLFAG